MKNYILTVVLTGTVTYMTAKQPDQCLSKKYIYDRYAYTLAQCINLDFDRDRCETLASDFTNSLLTQNIKHGCK